MDQIKIGYFIAERRKAAGLTQSALAEKLGVTNRAVSKWENGRSLPDASIMLALCDILKISVTELLKGEFMESENKNKNEEQLLLELVAQKERADKQLLGFEIVIGTLSVIILLGCTFAASFFLMEDWLRIVLIVLGFAICLVGLGFAIRIEQTAGYYRCPHCGHRYVPTYQSVLWSMHFGRTRYMKCPNCQKHGWQKKVVKIED
ncbi:MAG: helix-turn-helix domain-containing protein [Clostridia bacterium]|nr:helix-turn-helix domain-containing protein [Clostridia bacterium]